MCVTVLIFFSAVRFGLDLHSIQYGDKGSFVICDVYSFIVYRPDTFSSSTTEHFTLFI